MIELKTSLEGVLRINDTVKSSAMVHDVLAAHAYKQAIEEHRQVARDDADWIESRAAEILKEMMEGT